MKNVNNGLNVNAEEFVPIQQTNNQERQYKTSDKNSHVNMHNYSDWKKIEPSVKAFVGTEIDKKRNFTKNQGEKIWRRSKIHPEFDSEMFRLDLFGCIVAKDIVYLKKSPCHKFSYDLEHIVSHSNNGMTIVENGALLNSGVNRSKGSTECYKINENEYVGLKERFGIDPEELLHELENYPNLTCKKYNLTFIKTKENTWTLDKSENNELIHYENTQKYKNFPKNVNIKVNNAGDVAIIAAASVVVGIAVDTTLEKCITGYNHAYYSVRQSLGYTDIDKDTKLSKIQETIKMIGTVVITTGCTIAIAAFSEDKSKSKKRRKRKNKF